MIVFASARAAIFFPVVELLRDRHRRLVKIKAYDGLSIFKGDNLRPKQLGYGFIDHRHMLIGVLRPAHHRLYNSTDHFFRVIRFKLEAPCLRH